MQQNESSSSQNDNIHLKNKNTDLDILLKYLTQPLFPFSNTSSDITEGNGQSITDRTQKESYERGLIRNTLVKSISENVADLLSPHSTTSASVSKSDKQKEKEVKVDKLACTYISNLLTTNEFVRTNALNMAKSQRDAFLSKVPKQENELGYHQRIINASHRLTGQTIKAPTQQPPALPYILKIANNYISKNLKSTVIPIIENKTLPDGSMHKLSVEKLSKTLPLYQNTLNTVSINYLSQFLTDDRWRRAVKEYTKGFILTKTSKTVGTANHNTSSNDTTEG